MSDHDPIDHEDISPDEDVFAPENQPKSKYEPGVHARLIEMFGGTEQ